MPQTMTLSEQAIFHLQEAMKMKKMQAQAAKALQQMQVAAEPPPDPASAVYDGPPPSIMDDQYDTEEMTAEEYKEYITEMKQKKPEFKLQRIGTDAELFLQDEGGAPVPVCGLIGGTKEEPKPVLGGNGFAVQEDNVMLEFNIPPAKDAKAFQQSLDKMMEYITSELKQKGLTYIVNSAMEFEPEQLTSDQARTFGCEPDYCVWTRSANEIDKSDPALKTLRTAAAHIHISYTVNGEKPTIPDMEALVKLLDTMIGAPFMKRFPELRRRKFYGKAGAFRPKPYGIEYRVLGNEWISNPQDVQDVFERINAAFWAINAHGPEYIDYMISQNKGSVAAAINENYPSSIDRMTQYADQWLEKYRHSLMNKGKATPKGFKALYA
jgi:hypothetical protein